MSREGRCGAAGGGTGITALPGHRPEPCHEVPRAVATTWLCAAVSATFSGTSDIRVTGRRPACTSGWCWPSRLWASVSTCLVDKFSLGHSRMLPRGYKQIPSTVASGVLSPHPSLICRYATHPLLSSAFSTSLPLTPLLPVRPASHSELVTH